MSFPIEAGGRIFFRPELFNTDTPQFDAARKEAIQRRAQVEGKLPESHGYEIATPALPNDWLIKIALAKGVDPQALVAANRQFPDPNAISPGDIVFVPEKSPVSQQTERLVDNAVRFDREHPADAAGSSANWQKVQDAIAGELRDHGKNKAEPERDAASTVARIADWAIGTDRLRTTATAALTQVTGEWRAAGVTQDTLGKIQTDYGNFQQAQAHETALEKDPKASAADRAAARTETDRQAAIVRDEIARQLTQSSAADPKALPLDRVANIQDRANRIKALGPQYGDFRSLVDLAGRKVLVDDPAQRVADAYAHGGATEAAGALKTELTGTAPDYAAQILTEAQPTVSRIATDLGSKTGYVQDNIGAYGKEGEKRAKAFEDVDSIYDDLSSAVEVAGQSRTYGRSAVIATADQLAAHAPDHMQSPGSPLIEAVRDTSLRSGNTTLSLALAGALQRNHRQGQAALIAEQVAQDIEEQRQITEEATDNFFKLTGELSQLRADWAGLLTPEQMDKATRGYANRHPGFLDDFSSSLKNLQSEGNDAETIARAVATYGDQVKGINVPGTNAESNINKYWHDLTGDNTKVAFAMQQGGQSNANIAGGLNGVPGGPGDAGKASNPVPTTRSVRTLAKESVKAFAPKLSDTFAAPLNGAGSFLYAIGVSQGTTQAQARPNVATVASATYQAIGFGKETSELLARTAPTQLLERSALVNRAADFVLKNKGWKIFDTYFKVGAVGVDTAKGVDYLLQGDPVAAILSGASASGNAVLALSAARAAETPVLATLAARLPAGFSSGPWGAAIVVAATAGQYLWSQHVADRQQTERYENGTRDFLTDSGAVRPEVADALKQTDGDHHSMGPLLAALAGYDQTHGPQMLAFLNRQDPEQLHLFVDIAHGVKPDDNGTYPQTAKNDENFTLPGIPSYVPPPQGDRMPHSLRGLSLREPAVFGYGDSPRTPVG
jgi:hypothetical protein